MRYSVPRFRVPLWTKSPLPPKAATLLGVAGIICVLLTTFFGVSVFSDWLLITAQILLASGVIIFFAYIIYGIISDARAM